MDVYRLSIGSVAWGYEKADGLTGNHRSARDQWLRASPSIPLNIAEGNGKTAEADRRRYFEIARGSIREYGRRTAGPAGFIMRRAYPCFTDWQITGKKVAGVRW
jgi:hypothetical protein